MNTYTQLKSGAWGVRCEGTVSAGAVVTVTKKSGESKSETIAKVIWSGADSRTGKTVSICAIASSGSGGGANNGARRSYSGRRDSSYRGRRTGCSCGSIENVPRDSDCASCVHDY